MVDPVTTELQYIKWLLAALLAIALYCLFIFIRTADKLADKKSVLNQQAEKERLKQDLDNLLYQGMADSAKTSAYDWVSREPNEPYAHWFLAKSHYQLGDLVESKKVFSRIIIIEPGWERVVRPWIEKIDEEISNSGPTIVK